jgi:hypothetical protein
MTTLLAQLVEAPVSNAHTSFETLGYLEAYDAVINCDYAFVAYKETSRATGEWRIRIKSSQTAGALFEPALIKGQARSAGAQGKSWFQWGYSFDSSASDPRSIQFRVHVKEGRPSEIEMYVQLRKFDGRADDAKSVKFPWPTN